MVNLSHAKPGETERLVLQQGFNFCIKEKKINRDNVLEETYKYARTTKLRTQFEFY